MASCTSTSSKKASRPHAVVEVAGGVGPTATARTRRGYAASCDTNRIGTRRGRKLPLEDTGGLRWIGACNELNAFYAADGYARLNGLGALTVTNAVGAAGAINGIAGSCAEHVPVICICGSIPLRSIERGLGMHRWADGTASSAPTQR